MTEGTSTYEGLAVPLFGESEIKQQDITKDILTLTSYASNTVDFLVLQDSSNSEIFRIEDDGRIWMTVTKEAGDGLALYRMLSSTNTGQKYAATFLLDEQTYHVSSGRSATLNGRLNGSEAGNHAGRSFINFTDEGEKGTALFTILAGTIDGGGCVETISDPAATTGIVIYANNIKYWIMCSSAST